MPGMTVSVADRIRSLDWEAIRASLEERGHARTPPVLNPRECSDLTALYAHASRFRATIDMERHRFGRGEYRYFSRPLPRIVLNLRRAAYPPLAAIVNRWAGQMPGLATYPARLEQFLELCRRKGQTRPTPLLLRYETGGYNCLHRDLYGEVAFPLQLTVFLSRPGRDYDGGAFLLVEQRPRQQSIGDALLPELGAMVIFATAGRPVAGARGFFRASMRHGVARVTRGSRYTLGVIFHDAR
jgi:hypothetical protein